MNQHLSLYWSLVELEVYMNGIEETMKITNIQVLHFPFYSHSLLLSSTKQSVNILCLWPAKTKL